MSNFSVNLKIFGFSRSQLWEISIFLRLLVALIKKNHIQFENGREIAKNLIDL